MLRGCAKDEVSALSQLGPLGGVEKFGFVLVPEFSMIAFASAIEVLRLANQVSEQSHYSWETLSVAGAEVTASNGIVVRPSSDLLEFNRHSGEMRRLSAAFVCGGNHIERIRDDSLLAWLRRAERQGTAVGALCTGAHILARAGLMRGYRCVIHFENLTGFREVFPDIDVADDLFVIDRNRITCSGGTAAIDMMLQVVAQTHGRRLATRVSEMMLVDRIRAGHDRQRLPLRDRLGIYNPKLIAAIEAMEASITEPLLQDSLALKVGLSRRQLERLFRKHVGRSPSQYYLEIRLDQARRLLYQSDMPIVDVALACGFVSASHFSKCYRDLYSRSPREERAMAASG